MSDPRYRTSRWRAMRAGQLRREPLCRYCAQLGQVKAATVADHIVPHRGDDHRFWRGELQSLCAKCHSSVKQQEEKSGRRAGVDIDGVPVDRNHHWHQAG